jgi:ubiquinone/menaquinone biosynthesis C-methylase UbiE
VNNFDFIAPIYDKLVSLIFGESLNRAESFHLNEIQKNQSVLILGGGSGEILKNFTTQKVLYLDKSANMIRLAKKRNIALSVEYIQEDFLKFSTSEKFDWVICPFFLDCFGDKNLNSVISKIQKLMEVDGNIIVTDFQETSSKLLIRMMHVFFLIIAALESKKLKNIHSVLSGNGFKAEKEEFFHKNMIFSRVYGNL